MQKVQHCLPVPPAVTSHTNWTAAELGCAHAASEETRGIEGSLET